MTEHPFPARFGRPDPSVPNGVHYTYRGNKRFWQRKMLPVTGAGWFWDRFLFLFGEGLDSLRPAVDAWSAVLPPHDEYLVAGRNAYGTLMVELNPNVIEGRAVVFLDLHHGGVWRFGTSDLDHCIGFVLPKLLAVDFVDRRGFDAWIQAGNDAPGLGDCLAPKVVGAGRTPENFVVEPIVDAFVARAADARPA